MELESISANAGADSIGLYAPRVSLQIMDDVPYHTKAAMCRTKTHKYVQRLYEQDELYDLVSDPLEETTLIADPAYGDVESALELTG
jgi:hypothetical protein